MSETEAPFTADEIYRAHRPLASEEEARELAAHWEALADDIANVTLARGSYMLLWLLGGETAGKVEADYLHRLSEEERAAFEADAERMRSWLQDEGER